LVDSKTGLVKCQASVEENHEVVAGMETIIHKEDGGDVEAVFFPGAIDPRAVEDHKRLKFSKVFSATGQVSFSVAR
jgi:hypothetical protein